MPDVGAEVGVGDAEFGRLEVEPFDLNTTVALVVERPDGTTLIPSVATSDGGNHWATIEPILYSQPGTWRLHWTVVGAGSGSETQEVWVVPVPGTQGPAWRPARWRVADYVPGRTLVIDGTTHKLTFDSTTRPTGVMVDRLVTDACAWVGAIAGTVHVSLYELAEGIAARWAAASVERGYPDDQQTSESLQRANDLERIAKSMRDDLARTNTATTGGDTTNPAAALLPLWVFPPPVPWGDAYL